MSSYGYRAKENVMGANFFRKIVKVIGAIAHKRNCLPDLELDNSWII